MIAGYFTDWHNYEGAFSSAVKKERVSIAGFTPPFSITPIYAHLFPMSQSNSWCFTLNNPSPTEVLSLEDLYNRKDDVTYLVFQLEGDNQTPHHHQGFLQFVNRKQKKKILGPRYHVEKTKDFAYQNKKYCRKSHD